MKKFSLLAAGASLLPAISNAHIGTLAEHDFGLEAGLIHPFTGLDHLTMFIGAGIMLSFCQKKPITALSLTLGLTIGIILGSFMPASTVIEYSVAFTLLALAVFFVLKKYSRIAVWTLPFMAVIHGLAHGTEIPAGAALGFTIGSAISATFLVFAGYLLVMPLTKKSWARTGIAVAIFGAFGAVMGLQ